MDEDDGEAACCALALERRGTLITDDRRARRVMELAAPETRVLTTSAIIKDWSDRVHLATDALARLLLDIEERASFQPGRRDPLQSWWTAIRAEL